MKNIKRAAFFILSALLLGGLGVYFAGHLLEGRAHKKLAALSSGFGLEATYESFAFSKSGIIRVKAFQLKGVDGGEIFFQCPQMEVKRAKGGLRPERVTLDSPQVRLNPLVWVRGLLKKGTGRTGPSRVSQISKILDRFPPEINLSRGKFEFPVPSGIFKGIVEEGTLNYEKTPGTFQFNFAVKDLVLLHRKLGKEALRISSGTLLGRGMVSQDRHQIHLSQLDFKTGKVTLMVTASIKRDSAWDIRVQGGIQETPAKAVYEALPAALLKGMAPGRIKGNMAINANLHYNTRFPDSVDFNMLSDLKTFQIRSLGLKPAINALKKPLDLLIQHHENRDSRVVLAEGPSNFTPYTEIPKHFVGAVVCTEDIRFFKHQGFDAMAFGEAMGDNLKKRIFWRGGSTISQQLAKNLYLPQHRTIARKFQEMVITHQLERTLSKERLMEIYLNIIDWGPDIYGIRQAAKHFFNKAPGDLNSLESAYLASVISGPRKYYFYFRKGEVSEKWMVRVKKILEKMKQFEFIDESEYLKFVGQPVTFTQYIPQ